MWRRYSDNWSSSVIFFCVLGDGGGYLSGEDGRGGRGGAEAAADRDGGGVLIGDEGGGGVGLGGGVDLGGGGGRAVAIKDSIEDLSKLTLFLLGDGGYLSEVEVHGEDERGELGGGGDGGG